MTEAQKKTIQDKASALAAECQLQVLHFIARGTDSRPVLEIVLDGNRLVKVEDCEFVSRGLDTELEVLFHSGVNYRLDILSPGVEEPIKYDFQLERSLGKTLTITYNEDDKSLTSHGLLDSYSEKDITITERKSSKKGQTPKNGEKKTIDRQTISLMHQVAIL